MRPRKLRFVVATAFSPAARMPFEPPKHAPQVGVETIAPASTNRSSRPSAAASRQIACVAGTTIARVRGWTLRPPRIDAAWRRSVIVPFAQLPM